MFRLLEAITLLCSAWRWIIIVETCCHKVLKKKINKVVLDYILSIYLIIGYPHLENVEPSKYLCSMLANDGRCTCEIKSRIIMAKATFNKKRVFYWHIGLKIDEETNWRQCYYKSQQSNRHILLYYIFFNILKVVFEHNWFPFLYNL